MKLFLNLHHRTLAGADDSDTPIALTFSGNRPVSDPNLSAHSFSFFQRTDRIKPYLVGATVGALVGLTIGLGMISMAIPVLASFTVAVTALLMAKILLASIVACMAAGALTGKAIDAISHEPLTEASCAL